MSADLESLKSEIIGRYGNWTAHNIEYAPDKYTIRKSMGTSWLEARANAYGAIAELTLHKPLSGMRILDLGCLEGGLSYYLALMGARVVGLEVREANIEKAKFLQEVLAAKGIAGLSFVTGDMLKADQYEMGSFDIVIMAGTLYHVDGFQIIPFLEMIRKMCSGVCIIDTVISDTVIEAYDHDKDLTLYGMSYVEHPENTTEAERDKRLWASYQNSHSFMPTERSLINSVHRAGFEFMIKPLIPSVEWTTKDRSVWVAYAPGVVKISTGYVFSKLSDPDPRPHHGATNINKARFVNPNPNTRKL